MSATREKDSTETKSLGRLKSFGLKSPKQVPFLLPDAWDDLRYPITRFSELREGQAALLRGRLNGQPRVDTRDTPRMTFYIADAAGDAVGASAFGDSRELQKIIEASASDLLIYGKVASFNGRYWIRSPQVVKAQWVGRLRPVYPGLPRVMHPDTVRERVLVLLKENLGQAATWLVNEVVDLDRVYRDMIVQWVMEGLGLHPERSPDVAKRLIDAVASLLRACHLPPDERRGRIAQEAVEKIAALGVFRKALENSPKAARARFTQAANVRCRAEALPYKLSADQVAGVTDIFRGIRSGESMRRLLSGDVGSGKTAVYGLAAMSVLDGGGRVAILLPSQTLANQVHREFTTWWPDLKDKAHLITGASEADRTQAASGALLIGTTAILTLGAGRIDLMIVDEQHKYSREQREGMVDDGSHLLEVSATCIPRSQALCRYGVLKVSKLRAHVEKKIETRVLTADQRTALMEGVLATVRAGAKVLVIYPARDGESKKDDDLPSAAEALEKFEKILPGRTVLAHGGQTTHQNETAIRRMKDGSADLLVSTSVVEVGVNIPNLRRVVVVHAERFGLTALHQIRGRVAREGGAGNCDLFLPRPVGEDSMARLAVMERCSDGFELADEDLRLRGFGDLSNRSDKQSGADETFLFGRGVRVEVMDAIIQAAQAKI